MKNQEAVSPIPPGGVTFADATPEQIAWAERTKAAREAELDDIPGSCVTSIREDIEAWKRKRGETP
jgi:hypothetical protein